MSDVQEQYSLRVDAASSASARGDRTEAERLFSEALAIGEKHFGATDSALAIPLNELSRLYVRRAEHARAEPLLRRLLGIRRANGENNADVATVLAGLAAARRGLGDDVAAEDLYREALGIREVVHAPEHMSVVVTLEQLADTCVALGKLRESAALLERAVAARAKMLGPDHASVRGLRDRIAILASHTTEKCEAAPAPPAPAPPSTPEAEQRVATNQLIFIYEPEKPVRRASVRRERVLTPPFSAAVAAASLIAVPAHASAPVHAPAALAAPSLVSADAHDFETSIVPVPGERVKRESVPRRRESIEFAARTEHIVAATTRWAPVHEERRNTGRSYRFGAAALALLASALTFASSRLPSRAADASSVAPGAQVFAPMKRAPSGLPALDVAAPARLAVVRPDTHHVATVVAASPRSAAKQAQPAAEKENTPVAPDVQLLAGIGSVAIPETTAPNADSVFRATTTRHDAEKEEIGSTGRLRTALLADDHSETSPVLIGVIPQPRYPEALRAQGVEGVVVVRFLVGVDGSADRASMKVVRSPHDLFTEAVRSVLPKLHFQPGRTADAKPRAEWVQYSIQFSAK